MSNTIHIVVESGGEYEDKRSNNFAAFTTDEKAKECISRLEKRDAYCECLSKQLRKHMEEWEVVNPSPSRPSAPTLPKMPNLIKKSERTEAYNTWIAELEANREAILVANTELFDAYCLVFNKWCDVKNAEQKAFVTAYLRDNLIDGTSPSELMPDDGFSNGPSYFGYSRSSYYIETLEVVE